jgi:hypothetical protein
LYVDPAYTSQSCSACGHCWRLTGASQWIGSGLVVAGWILATTAAAGAARVLKRVG